MVDKQMQEPEANPFDAPDMVQGDAPDVGLTERARLNLVDSFYRGSIVGSGGMFARKKLADDPTADPAAREKARKDYESVLNDLARYDVMRDYAGPLEMSAAFSGQLIGGSLSPEGWINKVPGAGRLFGRLIEKPIGRIGESAVSQAAVQAVTDPGVQALSIGAGTQKEFDPKRTLAAAGLGAALGGGFRAVGEAAAAVRRGSASETGAKTPELVDPLAELRAEQSKAETARALAAADDPSLKAADDDIPAKPEIREEAAVSPEIGGDAQSSLVTPEDQRSLAPAPQGDVTEPFKITVQEPQTLLSFLKSQGLKDFKGELRAADINKRFPGLVRKTGMELDKAREAAEEAGYLPANSSPDDLVQAILSDEPVYSIRDRDQAMEFQAQKQAKDYADNLTVAKAELRGIEPSPLFPEIHDAAARLMVDERMGAEDALATAAERAPRVSDATLAARAPKYEPALEGLQFKKRTATSATGESVPKTPIGQAVAAAGEAPNNRELLSLQEQGARLAEEIGHPLRQGRVQGGSEAEGQFDVRQGVVRVKNIADFETIAHESGHYIERKLGADFSRLLNDHALELAYLDYDPARMDVSEGFAEYARQYITAPQAAQKVAPEFTKAFEAYLAETAPAMLESLQSARGAYGAWEAAPSGARLDAMVKTQAPEGIIASIRKDGLPATLSNVMRRAYEGLFDDKAPVTRAVRDLSRMARNAGGDRLSLEGADNPEVLARLFSRAQQAGVRSMMDGVRPYHRIIPEGPSLRDALIKASGTPGLFGRWDEAKLKEFSNYLAARRISVLWDKKDAGLLERRPAAMTKGDAADAIATLEQTNPSFAEAAQMVHDYTRQLLRKMFDGGLIERETYDALSQEAFYVPLYRDMTDKPSASGAGSAGGARTEGPGATQLIKRQRGSDRDIIDPVQSIMTQTFLVERTLAHNDMVKSFVDLARAAQKAGAVDAGRIIEEIPPHQIVGQKFDLAENLRAAARQNGIDEADTKVLLGGLADVFGEDPIIGSMFHQEPTGKRGEPIIFYKEGGKLRAARVVSDKEGMGLFEALTALPSSMRDWAVTLGSASATMLRAGVTTAPQFALANFMRDQLATAILRTDFLPFWDGLRGVGKEVKQGREAQLYAAAGGMAPGSGAAGMSDLIAGDINELARKGWAVQRLGGISDLLRKGDVLAGAKAVADTVSIAESGTRLAVFEKVFEQKKAQGLSDYDAMLEAAYQATDLMDFSRHGSGTEYIRKLVPFLNAHIQGLDKARRTIIAPLYRAAVGDVVTKQEEAEIRNAGAALFKLAGVGGALGYAYGLWASQHQSYQDANDRLRATHIVLPGGSFGMGGKVIVIPKPFELAAGFNLGEMLALATAGDPRSARFARDGAYEVLAPPNVLESIPLVKTWAELALNRSFFNGRDIVPENMQKLQTAEQFKPTTSNLAKQIGRAINVSPIKVDYAIGQTFGSWGRDILSASNTVDPDAPEAAIEDSMFARRFVKNADRGNEAESRYWQMASDRNGEFVQAKATYEDKLGRFKDAEAAQFLAGLPEAQRAYVTLTSAADESGKAKYGPGERRLHPLIRAAAAVSQVNGYVRELTQNAQAEIGSGSRQQLNPSQRRNAIDALNTLKAMEQQNALILMKEPGFERRKLQDVERQFSILKFIAPVVADELATRYATAKIVPTETVLRAWPEMSKRLLNDGGQADLRDISMDARSDGFSFGGEKTARPRKRRVPIASPVIPSVQ